MSGLFSAASHATTPIGLAAFVVAAVILLINQSLRSRNKEIPSFLRFALGGSLVVVLFALLGEFYLRYEATANSVYRVRVTVIGPNNLPIENAKVWSSSGGEPKAVAGGFEFDIPFASKPAGGQVTFSASAENDHAQGKTTLILDDDRFPSIPVTSM